MAPQTHSYTHSGIHASGVVRRMNQRNVETSTPSLPPLLSTSSPYIATTSRMYLRDTATLVLAYRQKGGIE